MVAVPFDILQPPQTNQDFIVHVAGLLIQSWDSWTYPYQRTPMENPYISPMAVKNPTIWGIFCLYFFPSTKQAKL